MNSFYFTAVAPCKQSDEAKAQYACEKRCQNRHDKSHTGVCIKQECKCTRKLHFDLESKCFALYGENSKKHFGSFIPGLCDTVKAEDFDDCKLYCKQYYSANHKGYCHGIGDCRCIGERYIHYSLKPPNLVQNNFELRSIS